MSKFEGYITLSWVPHASGDVLRPLAHNLSHCLVHGGWRSDHEVCVTRLPNRLRVFARANSWLLLFSAMLDIKDILYFGLLNMDWFTLLLEVISDWIDLLPFGSVGVPLGQVISLCLLDLLVFLIEERDKGLGWELYFLCRGFFFEHKRNFSAQLNRQ